MSRARDTARTHTATRAAEDVGPYRPPRRVDARDRPHPREADAAPLSHKRSLQTGPAREVPAPPSARGAEEPPHLFSSFQEFTVLPAYTLPTISVLRSEISPPSVMITSEIMMRNNFEATMERAHGRDKRDPPGSLGHTELHPSQVAPQRHAPRAARVLRAPCPPSQKTRATERSAPSRGRVALLPPLP